MSLNFPIVINIVNPPNPPESFRDKGGRLTVDSLMVDSLTAVNLTADCLIVNYLMTKRILKNCFGDFEKVVNQYFSIDLQPSPLVKGVRGIGCKITNVTYPEIS